MQLTEKCAVNDSFASPCCRAGLAQGDGGLDCISCGRFYPIQGSIHKFIVGNSSHGEFSREEIAEFLAIAREHGWRTALEQYAAPKWPNVVKLLTDPRRYRSLEPLKSAGGGRVLDFGCGYGGVSVALADMFDEVVALDGSEVKLSVLDIRQQQEKIENIIPVCHIDPVHLPFPDDHFDAVTLIGVLEYLPESLPEESIRQAHQKCLAEIHRILRPGGHLLIHTKNRFGWQYWLGGRDNSQMRFAPVLPVPLADLILRTTRGVRYRIINHSFRGYRQILGTAHFDRIIMQWPVPGYQAPDYLIDLDEMTSASLKRIDAGYHSWGKRALMRTLCTIGLLKFVVPNYCIVATKPH